MAATYQMLMGKFYLDGARNNLTVDGTSITLDVGNYYLCGYTAESTSQLCEHIQAQIVAETAHSGATVYYDQTNNVVVISLDSSADITFDDAGLATILGFTDTTLTGDDTYSSDQQPRYIWRPSYPSSFYPHNLGYSGFWNIKSSTIVYRSASGITYSVAGNELKNATIEWSHLPAADVITPTTGTVYQDFNQFWRDVCHEGQPFRLYLDRTSSASSNIVTAIYGTDDGENIGSQSDAIDRHISNYNGLWDVSLDIMEYNQA